MKYPDTEFCTYEEYKGKPYYAIKYIENGETYVGYGTYNPKVLSQYLKEYFMPSAKPEVIRCKDCKHRASYFGNCKLLEEKYHKSVLVDNDDFCSRAERKDDDCI